MICPKCKKRLRIKTGRARKIHGVWHHKQCPTTRASKPNRQMAAAGS